MALRDILQAVEARFRADGGKATFKVGEEHVLEHDAPPRIVWILRGGAIGPVDKGGVNPRPLKTRNVRVFAHVWAQDFAAADALLNRLLAAAHAVASGSVDFGSEDWPPQNSQLSAHGTVVIVDLSFRVPVTAPAHPTATAIATSTIPEIET